MLFWTPRILCILFSIVISLFALDVFAEDYSTGEAILAFLIHLIPTAAILAVLFWLSFTSFQRSQDYRDAPTLWRATLKTHPACWICHDNLGVLLAQQGELQAALAHLEAAVAIKPDNEKALNNLGNVLMILGRPEQAAARYAEAVRLQPDYAAGRYGLGTALLELRRPDEAAEQLAAALQLNPYHADAHLYYALSLLYLDRTAEAAAHCREALRLAPDLESARNLLERILRLPAAAGAPVGAPLR